MAVPSGRAHEASAFLRGGAQMPKLRPCHPPQGGGRRVALLRPELLHYQEQQTGALNFNFIENILYHHSPNI